MSDALEETAPESEPFYRAFGAKASSVDATHSLKPLVRRLYRALNSASHWALDRKYASLGALLTYLTTPEGRTDANCSVVSWFLLLSEELVKWDDPDWMDHLPADVRDIIADMAQMLDDAVSAPHIAESFNASPEQLLARLIASDEMRRQKLVERRADARASLWRSAGDLFGEPDDGTLPEVAIARLTRETIDEAYERVREAGGAFGATHSVWLDAENRDVPMSSLDRPALLIPTRRATSFHGVVAGAVWAGERLPDLGLFVHDAGIDVDYRMGTEWNPDNLGALIELLAFAAEAMPGATVQVWETHEEEVRSRCDQAIQTYLTAAQTSSVPG